MEIKKFFPGFKSRVYEGGTDEKKSIIKNLESYDIIIASYEKVRSDIGALKDLHFFYVVLDEGHIIKNPKAKITMAVKDLNCDKKLVLTGTPL
jgi:TATA-binding protein-associated factor